MIHPVQLSRRDERAITVLHVDDTIKTVASKADARVFGVSWDILATAAGVSNLADLWPAGTQPNNRTIWNAGKWLHCMLMRQN